MAQYSKASYWDERYTKDSEPFDWYQRYTGIKGIINQFVKRDSDILMAGCGNSKISEEMIDDEFTSIMNIDISKVVIEQNIERYKDKQGLQWKQMDVKALEFPDQSFDAVIAKATFDAILCGEGSTTAIAKMCSEVSRVLKPGGVFLIVSYGVPENRLNYLEKDNLYNWTVSVHSVPKPSISASALPAASDDANGLHYIYVCTKS